MNNDMKRYDNIKQLAATAVAAALLLASCSKENGGNIEPPITGEPAPLGVSVAVTPQTRSVVTGTEFAHGSLINIILHDADGGTSTYNGISMPYMFQKLTADPGVWIPTETEGLLVSDPADVYAHVPADLPDYVTLGADKKSLDVTLPATMDFGNINTSNAFESFYLKLRTTDADATEIFVCRDDADLMTGKGTQVSTASDGTKETVIGMKHALAMVVVYIKRAAGLTDNPDVRGIAIRNKAAGGPLKQGSVALEDNAFTPNAIDAGYARTMSGFPVDVVRYAMLVNPSTMAAKEVEMVLTTDGASYTMPMPAKTWASGKVYIYNIEISANEAQIGDVLLTDWPEWTEKPFELD